MRIYVGRWDLLPEDWEGINGLYEKSEEEIKAEISRQVTVNAEKNPYDQDNNIAIYTLAEFEETLNEGGLNGGAYFVKIFAGGKSVLAEDCPVESDEEISPSNVAHDIEQDYILLSSRYRGKLLHDIKKLLIDICPGGTGKLPHVNIEELYVNSNFARCCMYDAPKDEPNQFSLFEFGINKKGEIFANANSIYDDDDTQFCQHAFSVADLHEIRDILDAVNDGLKAGNYDINQDGDISIHPVE